MVLFGLKKRGVVAERFGTSAGVGSAVATVVVSGGDGCIRVATRGRAEEREEARGEWERGRGLHGDAWRRPGCRGRKQPDRRLVRRVCVRGEHSLCLLA